MSLRSQNRSGLPFILIWLILIGTSCNTTARAEPSPQITVSSAQAETTMTESSFTAAPLPGDPPAPTFTPTPLRSDPPTVTVTPTPTRTSTATPIPTYVNLRGEVLQLANCRYGPGAPYLYKYALIEGSNLEIIGRNDLGTWILVRAIGGKNPCWVKASLMKIKGDVMNVAPTYIPLPQSPYYGPATGVSAIRKENDVIVSWNAVHLRPGDDSEQFPYLVEAWICKQGQLVFTPVGSYETLVSIHDEPGCAQPSHGRLYAVEKHGYTRWVEIPWPTPGY